MTLISLLAGFSFALSCFPLTPAVLEVQGETRALLGVVVATRTVTIDGRNAVGLTMKTEGSTRVVDFIYEAGFIPYGMEKGARIVASGRWDGEQLWGGTEPAGDASVEGEFDYLHASAGPARLEFELQKDLDRLKRLKKGRVALLRRLAGHPQFVGKWSGPSVFINLVEASLSDPKLQAFVIAQHEILRAAHERARLEERERWSRWDREADGGIGLVLFTLLWIIEVVIVSGAAIWIKRRVWIGE